MLIPPAVEVTGRCRAGCCRLVPELPAAPLPRVGAALGPGRGRQAAAAGAGQRQRGHGQRCGAGAHHGYEMSVRATTNHVRFRSLCCLCLRGELTGSRCSRYDPWWADSPLRPVSDRKWFPRRPFADERPLGVGQRRSIRNVGVRGAVATASHRFGGSGRGLVRPRAGGGGRARCEARGPRAPPRSRRARRPPGPRCRPARHRSRAPACVSRRRRAEGMPRGWAGWRIGVSAERRAGLRAFVRGRAGARFGLGLRGLGGGRLRRGGRWLWSPPCLPRAALCPRQRRRACRSAGAGGCAGARSEGRLGAPRSSASQSSHAIRPAPSGVKQFERKLKRSGPLYVKSLSGMPKTSLTTS